MTAIHHSLIQSLPNQSSLPGFLIVQAPSIEMASHIISDGLSKFFPPFSSRLLLKYFNSYSFAMLLPETCDEIQIASFYEDQSGISFLQGYFWDEHVLKKSNHAQDIFMNAHTSIDGFKEMNGAYSGFQYYTSDKLYIYTDSGGIEKVYYYDNNNIFIATNNLYSIISNNYIQIEIDLHALSEMILYQYPVNNCTIEKHTKVILPEEIVLRKSSESMIRRSTVYHFDRSNENTSATNIITSLDMHFSTLKKYLSSPLGLYLSTGKDSRILLNFLQRHGLDYRIFNFNYGSTGAIDSPKVERLAACLGKDVDIIDNYDSDITIDVRLAMDSTFHTEWMAIADLANTQSIKNFIMGTEGSAWSGKLMSFRNPEVRDKYSLLDALLKSVTKGSSFRFEASMPMLVPYSEIRNNFIDAFSQVNEEYLCDVELRWWINYRAFRNTCPILHRCKFYGSPIHPFYDRKVMQAYFQLPIRNIRSQYTHTMIAATDNATNMVPSLTNNIPLVVEKYIRGLILMALRTKAQISKTREHGKTAIKPLIYHFRSEILKDITGGKVEIYNKRLEQRIQNTDAFFLYGLEGMRKFKGTVVMSANDIITYYKALTTQNS